MKYIKKFEVKINGDIEVGDYVLMYQQLNTNGKRYKEFIDNNIGKIMKIDNFDDMILVEYENIPTELLFCFRIRKINDETFEGKWFNTTNIIEYGKTKEEVEIKIQSKKYNL